MTGFDSAWAEGQLGRIDCLSRSPYRRTLQLDTDTRVQSTDLEAVFDQLGASEIAMVEEAADVSLSRARTGRRMFNVGFILYRMTPGVLRCLDAWATRVRRNFGFALQTPLPFVEELSHVSDEDERRGLLRMDQVALMEVLSPERNEFDLSCTQLGSAWNYRGSALAYCQPDQVKIAHSDAFKKTTHADILALAFDSEARDPKLSDKLYEYVASRQPHRAAKPPSRALCAGSKRRRHRRRRGARHLTATPIFTCATDKATRRCTFTALSWPPTPTTRSP